MEDKQKVFTVITFHLNTYQELVGSDTAGEFASSKEQLRFVTSHVKQLCEMTGRIADRTKGRHVVRILYKSI